MRRLRETVFTERRKGVALLVRDLVSILRERAQRAPGGSTPPGGWAELHEEQRKNALVALSRLETMGYCERCALDAGSALLRARYAELVT
jgi:hypothetical protein